MSGQGGKVVEYREDYLAARENAMAFAAEQGLHMVPPYHYDIVRGVANLLELVSSVAEIDVEYVPIGMGSGICSAVAYANGLGLKTKGKVWFHDCAQLRGFVRAAEGCGWPAIMQLPWKSSDRFGALSTLGNSLIVAYDQSESR